MFKTYVLTNNIKVNTTKFLSKGLMKLATKIHGDGHLPPRRFIFNWPLLTRSFLLIPYLIVHFLWFHARIMEQHNIYKCYYSYKCWICAELCEAFIFLMENIYTYVQFEGMIYQQIVGIPMGTNCAQLSGFVILSQQRWRGYRAVSLIVFYLHFCQNWDMHIVGIVRTCSISWYTLKLNQK